MSRSGSIHLKSAGLCTGEADQARRTKAAFNIRAAGRGSSHSSRQSRPRRCEAEVFTGSPGKLVDLQDTIKGFKGLVDGKYDHLPEAAFYMVGTIEEAVEKGKKLAEEA